MTEGVSLGWNCHSAVTGVQQGLRRTKENGYKTCPFDEMVTNYKGIVDCILDDFKFFCDENYLELVKLPKEPNLTSYETIIYNRKYKFIFNHESPGHADLYISQGWAKGINHYILNNYEEFKNRYNKRIQNFKDLLNSGKKIIFILTRPNTQLCDINELNNAIKLKYPNLIYRYHFLDVDKYYFYKHLLAMNIDENDDEIKRLNI
jgi:hypothetical protein